MSPRPLAAEAEDRAALARYLADNPAMTVRDFKGKGFTWLSPFDKYHVRLTEKPWDQLDVAEVRRAATRTKARFLSRGQRQAAARDPGLIWDDRSRSYRLRDEATPAPQEDTRTDGRGHQKLNQSGSSRPAAGSEIIAMPKRSGILTDD